MDKQERWVPGLGGGGLVIVALLLGGALVVNRAPLESGRPESRPTPLEQRQAVQDIDARLWQDPFDAVAKAREKALKTDAALAEDKKERRSPQRLVDAIQRRQITLASPGQDGDVTVAAIMLANGTYAETVESRLRTRYAVLAGLKARGFVPDDNEHLGYYYPMDGEGKKYGLPEVVPYEFFSSESREREPKRCQGCGGGVLVLWLDGSSFHERPLQKLATLAQGLTLHGPLPADARQPRWRVLGPFSSEGLRALVKDADTGDFDSAALQVFDLRFFSANATAPDAALLKDTQARANVSVSAFLDERRVTLRRTIGTDDQLARALVNELELRGLLTRPPNGRTASCPDAERHSTSPKDSLPSQIAIVAEADTLYGRSLRQQFSYQPRSERPGFCLTRWHYFRGLDGRVPGDAPLQRPPAAGAKKDGKTELAETIGRDAAYDERAEGSSQLDYLRRLAIRMRDEDAALRRKFGREYGIRAIGVLGNDVYDKLLVLNALQTQMPHAIFFTTDMDARLFHPREQAWARNLIVASNFGLQLDDPLQRDIPPFRDSYQTSTYLATLLLLASAGGTELPEQKLIDRWFAKPRLFEVTRSGVFDFSGPAAANPPPFGGDPASRCRRRNLAACNDIHPDGSPMVPQTSFAGRWLVFAALTLALWTPALALSSGTRRWLRRFVGADGPGRRARPQRMGLLVLGFGLLTIVLPMLLAWGWPPLAEALTRDGKPLTFTDGISPWPTYAIRLSTLVLCLYLVAAAWASLSANADRISSDFGLDVDRRRLLAEVDAEEDADGNPRSRWRSLMAMLQVRFYREPQRPLGSGPASMTATAELFWKHYLLQNRASARLLRTGLALLLMIVLSVLVLSALGEAPIAPQRGSVTARLQALSAGPVGLTVLFLLLFVADATVLCVFFVHGLRLHSASWPAQTLAAFKERTGVDEAFLNDWIDLEFVARRTRCVGRLIYYPFIVLSLMLLARSKFFDDWYTPPGIWMLATLNFAIVLACAFALRHAAETSRQQALERLQDKILKTKGEKDSGGLVGQLELLRQRIQNLREGAFAPYSQQPLLKAVLLPLMTVGGSSLFEYLTLANL